MMEHDLFTYPQSPGFKERGRTSEAAARKIAHKDASIKDQLYVLLLDNPDGLTADEAADMLGADPLNTRPRLSQHKTLFEKTDLTRPNSKGNPMAVYRARRGG